MMGGPGGQARLLSQETSRPVNASTTLARLAGYFKPYWLVMILVALLIIGNTYTQVITPNLTGQAVDCFITPATTARLLGSQAGGAPAGFGLSGGSTQTTSTNCWFSQLYPKTATT